MKFNQHLPVGGGDGETVSSFCKVTIYIIWHTKSKDFDDAIFTSRFAHPLHFKVRLNCPFNSDHDADI